MNAWKRFFLFLALAVLQLHAAIPHHHHTVADLQQHTLQNCTDAENDLSHPDLGDNHLEDLTEAQAKRLWLPIFEVLYFGFAPVLASNHCPPNFEERLILQQPFSENLRRGPPLF
jgi:hypothetical protein